jgi:para-nitrobenzyl esterase
MDKQVIVTTKNGQLEGEIKDELYVFKGVPYAAPPVGALRWRPPQPVKNWDGVRQAKAFGSVAPQAAMQMGPVSQVPQPQSEDCLFLNIWTPGLDKARRPVMVWIHGGAFTIGSGSDPMYDSDVLVRRGNIVLVTINYRLGILGFMRLKDATKGKIPATGNEGLLDQVAALQWVKENIAAFGGDPDNVTVFGESAGSMSIGCLIVMPAAKGLFKKAILESGVGSVAFPLKVANQGGEAFLQNAGIKAEDADSLLTMTAAQLMESQTKLPTTPPEPGAPLRITMTMPVIDGEIIQGVTNELAKKGYAKGISAIIGSNLDEFTLFSMNPADKNLDEAGLLKRVSANYAEDDAKTLIESYRKALEKRSKTVKPYDIMVAIGGDQMFRMEALKLVEAQRDNQQKVFNYLFTWKSPAMGGAFGACHALEIGFVFGKYDANFCGSGPDADKLATCIQDAWLAFARTGDPSCESIGQWPEYGSQRMTMILDKDCHVEAAPYEAERSAWQNIKRKEMF